YDRIARRLRSDAEPTLKIPVTSHATVLSSPVKKKNKERDDRLKIRTEKAGHICRNDDQLHNTESNLQCISNPASGPICSSNNLASTFPLDPANIFIPTSEAQLDNATDGKHTSDKVQCAMYLCRKVNGTAGNGEIMCNGC
ncbi:hypothetical protein U1Q18_052136, partial [Sarracenia purpurea var. burkii]